VVVIHQRAAGEYSSIGAKCFARRSQQHLPSHSHKGEAHGLDTTGFGERGGSNDEQHSQQSAEGDQTSKQNQQKN
jgi:hypothetical protein